MKQIIFYSMIILASLSSCTEEMVKADAYGNFETNTTIVSSQAKGKLLYLNVDEGKKLAINDLIGIIDTTQLHLQRLLLISQKKSINGKTVDPNPEIAVYESQLLNIQREKKKSRKIGHCKSSYIKTIG